MIRPKTRLLIAMLLLATFLFSSLAGCQKAEPSAVATRPPESSIEAAAPAKPAESTPPAPPVSSAPAPTATPSPTPETAAPSKATPTQALPPSKPADAVAAAPAPATDAPAAEPKPTPAPAVTAAPPSEAATGSNAKPQVPANSVLFSIIGDKELGTVLKATPVEIVKGDTVFELLKRVTRQHKIQMEFKGTGAAAYIEGIDNLYEFDKGGKSGWMYRVNGQFPSVSAGAYAVKEGDTVEWLYTLDLGKDLGAKE